METRTTPARVTSLNLGADARRNAEAALGEVVGRPRTGVEELMDAAFATMMSVLPAPVLTAMTSMRQPLSAGSLLIRDMPVDPVLTPTPTAVTPDLYDLMPIANAALLGTVRVLGEVFSYRAEYDGEIVTHVLPARSGVDSVSSRGSRARLPYHTEDVHLAPLSPDYVALLCLRPDPEREVRTSVVHSADIRRALPGEVEEVLRLPLFRVRAPLSFGERDTFSPPIAVLRGPRDCPEIAVELTDMVGLTPAARHALDVVSGICREVAVDVVLDSGDLLLIDNRRVLHGRTSFEPRFDGTDRWCIRVLVKAGDLWDWRLYLDGRSLVV